MYCTSVKIHRKKPDRDKWLQMISIIWKEAYSAVLWKMLIYFMSGNYLYDVVRKHILGNLVIVSKKDIF
jgi:hypothetical protein